MESKSVCYHTIDLPHRRKGKWESDMLITSMITDCIGRNEVLLPINYYHCNFRQGNKLFSQNGKLIIPIFKYLNIWTFTQYTLKSLWNQLSLQLCKLPWLLYSDTFVIKELYFSILNVIGWVIVLEKVPNFYNLWKMRRFIHQSDSRKLEWL